MENQINNSPHLVKKNKTALTVFLIAGCLMFLWFCTLLISSSFRIEGLLLDLLLPLIPAIFCFLISYGLYKEKNWTGTIIIMFGILFFVVAVISAVVVFGMVKTPMILLAPIFFVVETIPLIALGIYLFRFGTKLKS
jgi:hypothetical protein